MTFFIIAGLMWFGAFVLFFVVTMIQKDHKFGRFNWQVSLAAAIFSTTVLPIICIYRAAKRLIGKTPKNH